MSGLVEAIDPPAPGATSGVKPHVSKSIRREVVEALRRFVRGEMGQDDLEGAAARLDLRSLSDICDGLSPRDIEEIEPAAADVARQLGLHLEGRLSREDAFLWFHRVYGMVTSPAFEASTEARPAAATLLGLVAALLDPEHPAPSARRRRSLARVRSWLEEGAGAARYSHDPARYSHDPARYSHDPAPRILIQRILGEVFRASSPVRLTTLGSPLDFSAEASNRWSGQWVDVAWRNFRDGRVRLIPFSVFTATFFRHELPGIVSRIAQSAELTWVRDDPFYCHPENDQAILLAERHPWIVECPLRFHYYIDDAGLAEIVIDAPAIGRREAAFAAGLFCLRNSIASATLDGRRIEPAAIRI
jgi:hypothetical protein